MIRSLLFSIMCCFFALSMKAQLNFGAEAGSGVNGVVASNVDSRLKLGGKIGLFINYSVGDEFFETGVSLTNRGYDMTGFIPAYNGYIEELDLRMDYVEVPLLIGYNYPITDNFRMVYKTGLYLAWGVQGNGVLTGVSPDGIPFEKIVDNVFKDEQFTDKGQQYNYQKFNKFDIGAKIGVDFLVKDFVLRISYTYGFKNMHSHYDKNIKNNGFDVSFGYNFSVKNTVKKLKNTLSSL